MFEKQPWMRRAGEYPEDDRGYFALLARAVFSAGLGPRVVESRWASMCDAFHEFQPKKVALMDDNDVSRLLADPNVIRNRRKIEAVIENARRFLDCTEARGRSFHEYLAGLGVEDDLERAAAHLSEVFVHLGKASAMFFLFSAGWRLRETVAA